jgi:hypothetical protein
MHVQSKWQGSGTSSSETIASLSRVCNFSSNIINETLKSIFVKHLNTHGRAYIHRHVKWCQRRDAKKGWKFSSLPKKNNISTASTANGNFYFFWGKSAKLDINLKQCFHQICFGCIKIGFLYFFCLRLVRSFCISSNVKSGSCRKELTFCLLRFFFFFFFFIESISV